MSARILNKMDGPFTKAVANVYSNYIEPIYNSGIQKVLDNEVPTLNLDLAIKTELRTNSIIRRLVTLSVLRKLGLRRTPTCPTLTDIEKRENPQTVHVNRCNVCQKTVLILASLMRD